MTAERCVQRGSRQKEASPQNRDLTPLIESASAAQQNGLLLFVRLLAITLIISAGRCECGLWCTLDLEKQKQT